MSHAIQVIQDGNPINRSAAFKIAYDHFTLIHRYPTEGKLEVSGQPPPREMQYPVMETEHKNVFEPQPMPDPGKHKELTAPMFKIDR